MTLSIQELETLAVSAFESRRWRRAEGFLQQLVLQKSGAESWFRLGVCRHNLGDLPGALDAFDAALAIAPEARQARLAAISLSCALGHPDVALAHAELLCQHHADPQAHCSMAVALELLGDKSRALACYERALAMDPLWHDALLNRGALLLEFGDIRSALDNCRFAVEHYPGSWQACFNLAEAYSAEGNFVEAAAWFGRVRALQPDNAKALLSEAYMRCRLHELDDAQKLLDEAWTKFPEVMQADWRRMFPGAPPLQKTLSARSFRLLLAYEAIEQCDWRGYPEFIEQFLEALKGDDCPSEYPLAFRALACGVPPDLQLRLARKVASQFEVESSSRISCSEQRGAANGRLRVGYLSANMGRHATGLISHRLFELHDRDRFEIFAYAIGPRYDDDIRESIELAADQFSDLAAFDDDAAARVIAADGIDILIDLSGYTSFARPGILARRPAPVQMACIAYPATSGAKWIDYLVLDGTTASGDMDRFCSERIIRMPYAMAPCSYADSVPVPQSREALGLPQKGVLLAAFHSHYKIDPTVFAVWMRLLLSTTDAYLWLLQGQGEVENNLRREAKRAGVDPARLIFAPRVAHGEHLSRFSLADVFLDTKVCNGGSTVCDALVAGVPVLTCTGQGVAQRLASGYLTAAGFGEGIADNLVEYESKASEWLSDRGKLQRLRQELVAQRIRAPFYQTVTWVRDFEVVLTKAYDFWNAGLAPRAFSLSPHAGE